MAEALLQCAECNRHVRVSEGRCPFCGTTRHASEPIESRVEPIGLSRAALLALGATLTLTDCDAIRERLSPGRGEVYGGPPVMAVDASPPIVMPYGAPVPPPPADAAPTVMAVYGAPIPAATDASAPPPPPPTPPRK